MTIIFQGHVKQLESAHNPRMKVRVTIATEQTRGGCEVVVEASAEEIGNLYLPGAAVQIAVTPVGKP